jgi:hypothetical protein
MMAPGRLGLPGLTGVELAAVATIWKRDGRELVVRFSGVSMEPTIGPDDDIRLRCQDSVEVGDVIAFVAGERVVLHRLVARSPDHTWFMTRGDAHIVPDAPIDGAILIGTAVEVRGGEVPRAPDGVSRRLALRLARAASRRSLSATRAVVRVLLVLERWLVLAPRSLGRRLRPKTACQETP